MLTTQEVAEKLKAAGLILTLTEVADLARCDMFPGAIKSAGVWQIPVDAVELFVQQRQQPRKPKQWRIRLGLVAAVLLFVFGAVSATKDGWDLIVGNVIPLFISPVAEPLSIRMELDCSIGSHCVQMSPSEWSPKIPSMALEKRNMDEKVYQYLIEEYGEGRVMTFPIEKDQYIAPVPPFLYDSSRAIPACVDSLGPTINIILTNAATRENITVNATPIIQIKSVEPLNDPVHTLYIVPEGIDFKNYMVTLRRYELDQNLYVESQDITENTALYYLKSNDEPAALRVHLNCAAPGKYTLRLGFKYSYREQEKTKWLDQDIVIYSPQKYYGWIYRQPNIGAFTGFFNYNESKDAWIDTDNPKIDSWVEK